MRLRLISEFNKIAKRLTPLLMGMPKRKRKHSLRVGRMLKNAGVPKLGIYAGTLHDYIERGGDIQTLQDHLNDLNLPPQTINIIHSLSNDEKSDNSDPLQHLKEVISSTSDQDLNNLILIVKLADRIDNLRKRKRMGVLSKNYKRKSDDLVSYITTMYDGDLKPFQRLLALYWKVK